MNNTTNPKLPLKDYYDEAFNLVKQTIDNVRSRASYTHGKELRVGAILTPEHFSYEMRMLVFWRWHAVNDGVWGQSVRPVSYSAIVYPENNCIDRFYNPILPQDQGEWVLMFHQDFDYLTVSLSMVTTYMWETTSQNIAMPTSANDIVEFLRSSNDYEDHPNITSIVLSSHDGNANFQVVHEALDKFDVKLWNRRKQSSLELNYIAATGAACMARQYALFPTKDRDCEYRLINEKEISSPLPHVEL